jgi:ABC-type sulfate transport system permease component
MSRSPASPPPVDEPRVASEIPFYASFGFISGCYILMILAMLFAEATYTSPAEFFAFLDKPEVVYSIQLSLLSCALTTVLALWVAVPIGYLMSRHNFLGKSAVDAVLDVPIVLPPLVIGLCLLILFSSSFSASVEAWLKQCELFLAGHLVPLVVLAVCLSASSVFCILMRNRILDPRIRFGLPAVVTLLAVVLAGYPHVAPRFPAWFPTIAQFEAGRVTHRDQSPLRTSRHLYSGEFTFTGTVNDAVGTLEKAFTGDAFGDFRTVRKTGLDGLENGEHRVLVALKPGVDSDYPDGCDMAFRLVPQRDAVAITKLERSLDDKERELAPLRKLFAKRERRVALNEELDVVRRRMESIRGASESAAVKQQLLDLRREVDAVQRTMILVQAELDDTQAGVSTVDTALQEKRTLADLGEQRDRLERETAELSNQLDKARNAWQTDSLRWDVEVDVMRPEAVSKADIVPRLSFPVTYEIPAVILAQFMVACAFAVRTMRVTFDQIPQRCEQVALTLGCNHGQAFWRVVLPQAHRGMLAAGTLAWARSLGEFGPILIFAGSTRRKTEVLPTTVFLELNTGNLAGAASASMIIIAAAMIVLILARRFGLRGMAV